MHTYSILVNTCDAFKDCWHPFFKLMSLFWKDCNGQIFLNTEYKTYSCENLNIKALQVCKLNNVNSNQRATWSQCLIWALEEIKDEVVLYLQEDYFMKAHVKNDLIEEYKELMYSNTDIHCIHLTDQAVPTIGPSEKYPCLHKVALKQRYRVSCQAAFWRKDVLLQILRAKESAWEFEEFGSKRSSVYAHNFYCVDKEVVVLNKFEIIPYIFTGIIQGMWKEEVEDLFEKHNITIDYKIRGFVKNRKPKPINKRFQYRLNKIPKIINHSFELLKIKPYNE